MMMMALFKWIGYKGVECVELSDRKGYWGI